MNSLSFEKDLRFWHLTKTRLAWSERKAGERREKGRQATVKARVTWLTMTEKLGQRLVRQPTRNSGVWSETIPSARLSDIRRRPSRLSRLFYRLRTSVYDVVLASSCVVATLNWSWFFRLRIWYNDVVLASSSVLATMNCSRFWTAIIPSELNQLAKTIFLGTTSGTDCKKKK